MSFPRPIGPAPSLLRGRHSLLHALLLLFVPLLQLLSLLLVLLLHLLLPGLIRIPLRHPLVVLNLPALELLLFLLLFGLQFLLLLLKLTVELRIARVRGLWWRTARQVTRMNDRTSRVIALRWVIRWPRIRLRSPLIALGVVWCARLSRRYQSAAAEVPGSASRCNRRFAPVRRRPLFRIRTRRL